jgi:aminopeptidase YwaD
MHGRGYVNEGDRIAAGYISSRFAEFGLQPFGKSFLQPFPISINTFPDTVNLAVDGQQLIPGKDFVLFASSPSVSGTFELDWLLADTSGKYPEPLPDFTEKVVITDKSYRDFEKENILHSAGVIYLLEGKVWWHVSNGQAVKDYFQLSIVKEKIPQNAKTISIKANNRYFDDYQTQNVVGYIPGKKDPDKFFVFTAHYDHLGRMGSEAYFPGANDNASGTAMLLDLARYYLQPINQPDHSIVFMAFSAEEVGLLGSGFYVKHLLFPLENIKFLVNLDMVGSGSLGIKVVNGTVFKEAFEKLVKINARNEYILKVNERGEAANSDHYPFYAAGVPCFFIYTLGDECKEYHNIYDVSANVPLTEYEDVFRLLADFERQLDKKIK